jgi:hypothetical protein
MIPSESEQTLGIISYSAYLLSKKECRYKRMKHRQAGSRKYIIKFPF